MQTNSDRRDKVNGKVIVLTPKTELVMNDDGRFCSKNCIYEFMIAMRISHTIGEWSGPMVATQHRAAYAAPLANTVAPKRYFFRR